MAGEVLNMNILIINKQRSKLKDWCFNPENFREPNFSYYHRYPRLNEIVTSFLDIETQIEEQLFNSSKQKADPPGSAFLISVKELF